MPRNSGLSPVGSKIGNKERVITPMRNDCIEIRGARQNNLKGIDVDLPLGKLTVITGPSGSGKSSLAFQTIYAEGQRRYVETFSPYMRQFLDRMDKPRVDDIREGNLSLAQDDGVHVPVPREYVRCDGTDLRSAEDDPDSRKLCLHQPGRSQCRGPVPDIT